MKGWYYTLKETPEGADEKVGTIPYTARNRLRYTHSKRVALALEIDWAKHRL